MKQKITILNDGETLTHISGNSLAGVDYATLCGLDGNDPAIGQTTVPTPKGGKVNCQMCKSIWEECKQWRASDFEAGL